MSDASLSSLIAQREELERQIAAARKHASTEGVAQIRKLMMEHGLSLADLSESNGTVRKSSKAGSKVAVKYRNPETGAGWSGRGLKPKWLKEAMEHGKTPQDFAV